MLSRFELPVALRWERLMNGLLWGETKRRMRCDPPATGPSGFSCEEMQCWYNPAATCCFGYPWLNEAPSKGSVVKKQRTAWLIISEFCSAIYNNGFSESSVLQSFYLFRFRTTNQDQFINWSGLVLFRLEKMRPSAIYQVVLSIAVPWICCFPCDNNKEFHKQLFSSILNIEF